MQSLRTLENRARELATLHRSGGIREQPLRARLDALRHEATTAGHGAAVDARLRKLFPDVFDRQALAPLVSPSTAARAGLSAGHADGALAFFALQGAASVARAVAARVPGLSTSTPPPLPLETHFPPRTREQAARSLRALKTELAGVQVHAHGVPVDLLTKLKSVPGLSATQRARVLGALAEVRTAYDAAGTALQRVLGDKPGGVTYQDINWKHTRLEVDRLLDVALARGLSPRDTECALLASMFSDAVKTPGNFLVHNVHGAQAALLVLSRATPALPADALEDIVKATLEHQVGPPGFMGNVAMRSALKGAGVDPALIASIVAKVAHPFDNLTADGTQVAFTEREQREGLDKVGVSAWTVPHASSRHYAVSRTVIDADSLVNYACPDGWAKLAALHGPDQPPFLQEPLFLDGLRSLAPQHASALRSHNDAKDVISDACLPLYEAGLARTERAVEDTLTLLRAWVRALPRDEVPRAADGKVPYLDAPLDYTDPAQLAFARLLRAEGVRILRSLESAP